MYAQKVVLVRGRKRDQRHRLSDLRIQVRALVQVAECHLEHVRVCPGRGVFQQILYLLGTGGAELLEFGKAERALVRHFRFFPLGHPSRPVMGECGRMRVTTNVRSLSIPWRPGTAAITGQRSTRTATEVPRRRHATRRNARQAGPT
jgi:hypothetical protein